MVSVAFQIVASLAVTGAVAAVLWPMLRDGRRRLFAGLLAATLLTSAGLYRLVGTPQALQAPVAERAPQTLEEGVAQLQAALAKDPQRADGWALLGRSLAELGRHPEAADAYQRAQALSPDDPVLLTEAAQARANAHPQRHFDDTGVAWLERARALSPTAERATWLLGIAQRQRGLDAEAAATWESLLPTLSADAANALREQINLARSAAGQPTLAAPPATAPGARQLLVRVALDPNVARRARLHPDTTVFIIARVADGPPMPVAVEKRRLSELPLLITLDDADSPMPTQKLSELREVEVLARLSRSGTATPQADDLHSAVQRIPLPAARPVELVIGADAL